VADYGKPASPEVVGELFQVYPVGLDGVTAAFKGALQREGGEAL